MSDTPGVEAEVAALVGLVEARHGHRLTPEQLAEIRVIVQGMVEGLRALRRVPLTNADEPWPPFAAWRAEP